MKNLIKGLLDNGHTVCFGRDEFCWFSVDGDVISIENWKEAEEILLDYIINESDL